MKVLFPTTLRALMILNDMWNIDVTTDERVIHKAWNWYQLTPLWLKSKNLASKRTKDAFTDRIKNDTLFFGDAGQEGQVLVVAEAIAQETFEGHLFCPRTVSPEFVSAVIMYAKNWLFRYTDSQRILNVVRRRHWGLKRIVENAGFKPTGYSMWDASAADGQVFEGQLYMAQKD